MSQKVSKGFNLAKKYNNKITEVISHIGNNTGQSHLLLNLPQNLALSGYGSTSPLQNPEIFNSLVANLALIQSHEEMVHAGKTAINYGIRNKLFWRHYFSTCKDKFMSTEQGFNDFFRIKVCSSLGGLQDDEWLNDSILRKFKDEVQGCRYLMLMMVSFKL